MLFVVNDRPDIARLVGADGVHLGQDDLQVKDARRIVGPDLLIGVSTHTIEQVRGAIRDSADYIGVGPVFPSQTKVFEQLSGLAFVREVLRETSLPAFALGGITLQNVGEVAETGRNESRCPLLSRSPKTPNGPLANSSRDWSDPTNR